MRILFCHVNSAQILSPNITTKSCRRSRCCQPTFSPVRPTRKWMKPNQCPSKRVEATKTVLPHHLYPFFCLPDNLKSHLNYLLNLHYQHHLLRLLSLSISLFLLTNARKLCQLCHVNFLNQVKLFLLHRAALNIHHHQQHYFYAKVCKYSAIILSNWTTFFVSFAGVLVVVMATGNSRRSVSIYLALTLALRSILHPLLNRLLSLLNHTATLQ